MHFARQKPQWKGLNKDHSDESAVKWTWSLYAPSGVLLVCMYVTEKSQISCAGTETATDKADRDLQIECEASEAIQCRCAKADESKCSSRPEGAMWGSLIHKLEIGVCDNGLLV
jgi:hypothetical protein